MPGTKKTGAVKSLAVALEAAEVQCFVRRGEQDITSDWLSPHSWQRPSAFPPNPKQGQRKGIKSEEMIITA